MIRPHTQIVEALLLGGCWRGHTINRTAVKPVVFVRLLFIRDLPWPKQNRLQPNTRGADYMVGVYPRLRLAEWLVRNPSCKYFPLSSALGVVVPCVNWVTLGVTRDATPRAT